MRTIRQINFREEYNKQNSSIMKKVHQRTFLTFVIAFLLSLSTFAQNVGINSTGATPDASAMLDIVATDKGLLIPRIELSATNLQAPVTSPTTSLMIYNTATSGSGLTAVEPGFYYWNGASWERVNTGTVNYTETDPVYVASIANGITALDTANWNNHTIDTDTQLDSTDIDNLGFITENHIPAFKGFAYYSTGFSKSIGVWENLIIELLSYNSFSGTPYNTTTGEFTVPIAGFYRFNLHGYSPTNGAGHRYAFGVNVNGTLKSFSGGTFSSPDSPLTTFTTVIYLSVNDIVIPRMYSPISATLGNVGVGHEFWFEGEFVGK